MTDYLAMLENSYLRTKDHDEDLGRLEYLGEYIFDFTTYDGEMSALFAAKAAEVAGVITDRATFEYIKNPDNYRWYLLICNMPFFVGRLNWGMSIRGAWWNVYASQPMKLDTCGLWAGDDQITHTIEFSPEQWGAFIAAIVKFATQPEGREA